MRKNLRYLFLVLVGCLAIFSCKKAPIDPPGFEHKNKTLLLYLVANNNLSSNAVKDIEELKKGTIPNDNNLLVYAHLSNKDPFMLRIHKDKRGAIVEDTVYKFPTRNSATTASLTSVLNIVKTMYPADEHGLVLWSHGTGWLPKGYYKKGPIGVRSLNIEQGEQEDKYAHLVKSFGEEDGLEIDIKELAQAIPYKHSYIIFDACLMGGIEVMYELKDITDYIISSPAEILVGGFPYDKVSDAVFKDGKTDLEKIARDYYSYYNSFSGERQSATISLIKTEALANLAAESKLLFNAVADKMGEILPSKLQRYYRMNKHWFYDYGDILNAFKDYADVTKALLALDQVVIYKAATDNFLDISINPDKFYGVSSYFPTQPIDQYLEDYYKELEWNKAVGFVK